MANQEVGLAQVLENINQALESEQFGVAEALTLPALNQHPELPQLWFAAGNFYYGMESHAIAELCYRRANELEPNAAGYGNLGAVLRRMNKRDEALEVLERAAEMEPEHASIWNNIAACWVNEGEPAPGRQAALEALAINPNFARAHWNLALLQLEDGAFGSGFDEYRWGLGKDRPLKDCYADLDYLPLDYKPGQGERPRLIVTGEQGLGDELMMSSMLYDACQHFDITYDCHPRLVDIFRRSLPAGIDIYPTRKDDVPHWLEDWKEIEGPRYHILMADLGSYYRRWRHDFTEAWKQHAPFYQADEDTTAEYRMMLEALAEGRKIIGLATRGGHMKTARQYRVIRPGELAPLLADKRYMFVAMDYENVDGLVDAINQEYGAGTIYNFRAVSHHFNYDYTAALVAATDAVVTVCQSLFHLSACLDHPTLCLVPDRPAWRYGLKGRRAYWYPGDNIRLFRQDKGGPWDKPLRSLMHYLEIITGASK